MLYSNTEGHIAASGNIFWRIGQPKNCLQHWVIMYVHMNIVPKAYRIGVYCGSVPMYWRKNFAGGLPEQIIDFLNISISN